MVNILFTAFVSFMVLGLGARLTFAHELVVDNTIGVVLHVDPMDSPIVGELAQLHFSVTDPADAFIFSECVCEVRVEELAQTKKAIAVQQSKQELTFTTIFPAAGIYTVYFTAAPKQGVVFKPFRVTFTQRVERTSRAQFISPFFKGHNLHILLLGGGSLVALGVFLREKRNIK